MSELKFFTLKNRSLKLFCEAYNNGLRNIPELEQLINHLLIDVNVLKAQRTLNNGSYHSEMFIINQINEHNTRDSNLILHNIPECDSDNPLDRLAHNSKQVSDAI